VPGTIKRLPIDLKVFATLSACWSLLLLLRAFTVANEYIAQPLQAVIGGVTYYGPDAHLVLALDGSVFGLIAYGIFRRRRWSLILAFAYMAQVVLSHFIFIFANLGDFTQSNNVARAAREGPPIVLVTLYLWIRSKDLIFGVDRS
jgi:hypothetical protein